MLILGIETSCDETAAAVVRDGRTVLSNAIYSQVARHAVYGGVVPEIASRAHVEVLPGIVERALADAGVYNRAFGTCELRPIFFHYPVRFCTAAFYPHFTMRTDESRPLRYLPR